MNEKDIVEPLWCVHVRGPDSLIAQPDRETADRRAAEWNERIVTIAAREPHPYAPQITCVVAEWPHDAYSHAADLITHGGQPDDIC